MDFLDRSIHNLKYIPIISVRPSEMIAYEELPELVKQDILPIILLRPWLSSKTFNKTTERVNKAVGSNNSWVAEIDDRYDTTPTSNEMERESIREFRGLKNPSNGYQNWFDYISNIPNCIPCLQTERDEEILPQLNKFRELGRGVVIRLFTRDENNHEIVSLIVDACNDYDNIVFIFDFEAIPTSKNGELAIDLNAEIANQIDLFNLIANSNSQFKIVISSTSFPSTFEGISIQRIFERQLFSIAENSENDNKWNLVYSDRASVRGTVISGGGGRPYPRIDYPTKSHWNFKRAINNSELEKIDNYRMMSIETIESDYWDDEIITWGTQLIRETANGNTSSKMYIQSPAKATAARINIHIHQQLFYNEDATIEIDDDWID